MRSLVISKTPAVEATPDYADGDVIGGLMTLAAAEAVGDAGRFIAGSVYCKVDIGANIPIRVILFSANPSASTFTENSAPTIHADDLAKIIGVLDLSSRLDLGTPVVLFAASPNVPFQCAGNANIYAVAIAGGAINLGSVTDLTFAFGLRRD